MNKFPRRHHHTTRMLISCALLLAPLAHAAAELFLLTENRRGSTEAGAAAASLPVLRTGGVYYAMPNRMGSETSDVDTPILFTAGVLTDGNPAPEPGAGGVWENIRKGTVTFDLKAVYRVAKVRVHLALGRTPPRIDRVALSTWDEMLDAGSRPLIETRPQEGWNEFAIDRDTDKLRLEFFSTAGGANLWVSEVEILGARVASAAAAGAAPAAAAPRAAAGAYRAFDFGLAKSPVYPGFERVTETMAYNPERGFGWRPRDRGEERLESNYGRGSIKVPGLLSRDRGAETRTNTCDSLFRDFCGAESVYHSQVEQEFAADLPDGTYRVRLYSGDVAFGNRGNQPFSVRAEGQVVVDHIIFAADMCGTVDFDVRVRDGQLNLLMTDEGSEGSRRWRLSGLALFTANTAQERAAAAAALARLDAQIQAERETLLDQAFTKIEHVETNPMPPLSAAVKAQGLLLFVRDWMKAVYPNTIPTAAECGQTAIALSATPGEYEPAALGVVPLEALEQVAIDVTPLADGDHRIAASQIEIFVTRYANERMNPETHTAGDYTYHRAGSSWGNTYMMVPKILDAYTSALEWEPGTTRQIWLRCRVPDETPPGTYAGTISVRAGTRPAATRELRLTVLPFRLERSPRYQGMYWREKAYYPENRRRQLLDMARHGVRAVVVHMSPKFVLQNGGLAFDFAEVDALMSEILEAGLTEKTPWAPHALESAAKTFVDAHPALELTWQDAYRQGIAATLARGRGKGWPELLLYPVDEIGNSAGHREKFKRLGALIRQIPDARIYCTVNNFDAGVQCEEWIDYWCSNIQLTHEQEAYVRDHGKTYMRYGCAFNYNPRISRIVSGFGFWQKPALAMYYWHYQAINADPYNALDGNSRDWCAAYPAPDGPIPTIDWEAIREGIDDLDYIHTLELWLKRADALGRSGMAAPGKAILEEIRTCAPEYSQYDFAGVPNAKIHEFRQRLTAQINALRQALAPPDRAE